MKINNKFGASRQYPRSRSHTCNKTLLVFWVLIVIGTFVPVFGQDLLRDVVVERNVMIPVGDSVWLATDIYRPAIDGRPVEDRLPLVLQRTPYGKSGERFIPQARYFASQGYIVALQDLRGRYDSGGTFTKYNPLEAPDGAQTVEWLSKLPYVDGRVAMWGTSYGAHTQADAAKLNPKGLSALVINMGGMTNAWDHAVRQGGAFELGRELTWAFRQIPLEIQDPVVRAHFEWETIEDWYQAWPFRRGLNPLSIAPNFEDYMLEEYTHADYDDYWREKGINWVEYYDQTADVPMVHIGGWYDIFLRGTIRNYLELSRRQSTSKWMVIGPWTHSGNTRTYAGDVDFGPAAAIPDFNEGYQVRWFDYLLKGKAIARIAEDSTRLWAMENGSTGKADGQLRHGGFQVESGNGADDLDLIERPSVNAIPGKPIQLFIMGTGDGRKNEEGRLNHGGFWLESDSWPLPNTHPTAYYFHADGALSTQAPDNAIPSTTFTFDPAHPVPTIGGNVSARVKDGGYNQRERSDFVGSQPPYLPLRARDDVVVFQTEPLEGEVQVIGPITVRLFVSSDAVDTDFTVKLVDVYPPSKDFPTGFDLNLTDAIMRMSYRNGRHTRDLITPGEAYELTIEPFPTANVFKKGHRIRVDVSSSNFPRWDVNPNTGEPFGRSRRKIKADNTIYHSKEQPSQIILPIIPLEKD